MGPMARPPVCPSHGRASPPDRRPTTNPASENSGPPRSSWQGDGTPAYIDRTAAEGVQASVEVLLRRALVHPLVRGLGLCRLGLDAVRHAARRDSPARVRSRRSRTAGKHPTRTLNTSALLTATKAARDDGCSRTSTEHNSSNSGGRAERSPWSYDATHAVAQCGRAHDRPRWRSWSRSRTKRHVAVPCR